MSRINKNDLVNQNETIILFHNISEKQVAELLKVEIATGLSNEEAEFRLGRDGANKIEHKKPRSIWQLIIEQFSSIVIWLLAFAALVSSLTGSALEAVAILVVLLINAVIGFLIEWQAGRALDALKKATKTTARVRRDSAEKIIYAENLVAGDIVILSAGNRVPADLRILESANLRADESTLTGESVPVNKNSSAVEIAVPLADRRSMLYLGTTIVAGNALAAVTATGGKSELGRIGQMVADADEGQTPLQLRLADLGKRLVYIVLGIALVVLLAGILRGESIWLMLEISISLAVAAVPEGLPAVTTLILALGVLRMARNNAIVRRLAAVETLGSSTVICTDKTGTLTENRMTVQEYQMANSRKIDISETDETITLITKTDTLTDENIQRLLRVSFLCNESSYQKQADGQHKSIGDPTETALLAAAEKFGMDSETERSVYKKLREFPFDSTTKRMITVLQDKDCLTFAAMKGAPGVILDLCDKYISLDGTTVSLTEEKHADFLKLNEEMASRALRVLAFADKNIKDSVDADSDEIIQQNYTFLGFVGMSDPPRIGVAEAVENAQTAGIRIVMLTGDQINTARAIARKLNLSEGAEVFALHSSEMSESSGEKLAEMARRAHVFARVSPEDKLRIVKALQGAGEIVAVTGDGVNDAPALKQSNIGIAMGMRGTEVAKEAADIVLTDDNFSTIVGAIEGGRTIYANILKFVHLMFAENLAEVLVIFAAIVIGLPLPLLPLQILWINLVTDVFPALALAVEPSSPETMRRKPHSPNESMLSRNFMFLIFWQGLMLAAIALAAYLWALNEYGAGKHARTIALLTIVGVQLGHLFNCRSRSHSAFKGFFSNPYIFAAVGIVFVLQIFAIYFSPLAEVLEIVQPHSTDWFVIGLSLSLPIVIVEIVKAFKSK